MVQALAPGRSWGPSWVLLALVLVGLRPAPVAAQAGGGPPAAKKAEAKASEARPNPEALKAEEKGTAAELSTAVQEEAGVVDPTTVKKTTRVETFKDPRAEQALPIDKFPELPAVRNAPSPKDINNMATGATRVDRDQIRNYVKAQAAALTNHNFIKAVLSSEGTSSRSTMTAIDSASKALIEPISTGNSADFHRQYNAALVATLPDLLNNHLLARTEAIIALGLTGDAEAVPVFTKQLQDRNQVMMVKHWAARGLTQVAQSGRRELPDIARANAAAKALCEFLKGETDIAWPTQARALEALGSLRLASETVGANTNQFEMANTALRFLSDPNAKAEVRAWAAWALGMMRVPQAASRYAYPLIAFHIGQAVAEAGEMAASSYTDSPERATRLAGLLVYQFLGAFRGEDDVRDSGLLKSPGLGTARKEVEPIARLVQDVAVAAINLTSPATPSRERPVKQKELAAKVAALKDYLAKNPPTERRLVPGGPEFPGPSPRVAGAPR